MYSSQFCLNSNTSNSNTSTMADSDSDYEDIFKPPDGNNDESDGDSDREERQERGRLNDAGKKVRGKDMEWKDFQSFDTAEEYFESDIFKKMKNEFTLRRKNDWECCTCSETNQKHLT